MTRWLTCNSMKTVPTEAWLLLHTGERVECLLEQLDSRTWQATPVRAVSCSEIAQASVDVLPGNSQITFILEDYII